MLELKAPGVEGYGSKSHISRLRAKRNLRTILGVTQDRITCLTKIRPEEWTEEEPPVRSKGAVSSFWSHFKNEMDGMARNMKTGDRSA